MAKDKLTNLPFRLRVQSGNPDACCSRVKASGRYVVKLHGKEIGHGGTAAAAWRDAWRNT